MNTLLSTSAVQCPSVVFGHLYNPRMVHQWGEQKVIKHGSTEISQRRACMGSTCLYADGNMDQKVTLKEGMLLQAPLETQEDSLQ